MIPPRILNQYGLHLDCISFYIQCQYIYCTPSNGACYFYADLGIAQKKELFSQFLTQGYKDSNLENDGVRVRCLTVWR